MKKIFTIVLFICALFISKASFAASEGEKIAVVDLVKVVSASSKMKEVETFKQTKNNELIAFVKKAQADINKQTDEKKKKELAESYEKQIKAKREANQKEYLNKLKAVDSDITAQLSKKATELGYTILLPKTAVIFGGDDITETVLKVIK